MTRLPVILGLSVALGGCSLLPFGLGREHRLEARPISPMTELSGRTANPYYDRATAAIARRDYARALDLLQRARGRDATDVRVLNAFGVVYDKLGRFDLSTRYYGQALALDPGSTVIAQNLAYSRALQGPWQAVAPEAVLEPAPIEVAVVEPPDPTPRLLRRPPEVELASTGTPPAAVLPRPSPLALSLGAAPGALSACPTCFEGAPLFVGGELRRVPHPADRVGPASEERS